jgi:hypothetical protein
MKGLKVNMDMVNCGLLLVVLVLVVMCCVKRENFKVLSDGHGLRGAKAASNNLRGGVNQTGKYQAKLSTGHHRGGERGRKENFYANLSNQGGGGGGAGIRERARGASGNMDSSRQGQGSQRSANFSGMAETQKRGYGSGGSVGPQRIGSGRMAGSSVN